MRISDWSSDVCSSDLAIEVRDRTAAGTQRHQMHHRDRHQPAVDHRVEVVMLDAALVDDADIETGSTHVGGDDIAQFGLQPEMLAGRASGHWPGMPRLQCTV